MTTKTRPRAIWIALSVAALMLVLAVGLDAGAASHVEHRATVETSSSVTAVQPPDEDSESSDSESSDSESSDSESSDSESESDSESSDSESSDSESESDSESSESEEFGDETPQP